MKVRRSLQKGKILALTAAVLMGMSAFTVNAEDFTKHTDGEAIGYKMDDGKKKEINTPVVIDVSGKSVANGRENNIVTGLYVVKNSKLTVNKDVKITVKNEAPAQKGPSGGVEDAHVVMNGIYAGERKGEDYSMVNITGKVDIDVFGNGAQVNNGAFLVMSGGTIKTHELNGVDTYALLAKEGTVLMNTVDGNDGQPKAGMNKVDIYGNVGVLRKDYGNDKQKFSLGSIVALALTTPDSKWTGGILNEFEESGKDTGYGSVRLFLENGATWENRWVGAPRAEAPRENAQKYLYKGSKLFYLYGGETEEKAGVIIQNDGDRPLFAEHFLGHVVVKFDHDGKGNVKGGDVHIDEVLKPNSTMKLRTSSLHGLKVTSEAKEDKDLVDKTLSALAQKFIYDSADKEKNLKAKVEIAEGLTTPAISKDITYFDDNHRGVYRADGKIPEKKPESPEKKFEAKTGGYAVGHKVTKNATEVYQDVIIDVSGSGLGDQAKNVVGLYVLDGGQVTINGNVKATVKNAKPATRGSSPGADVAHYYMSGIYAGYGGKTGDGNNRDSKVTIKGNVDMDVVGLGLQANHDGYITVLGGGKIKTYDIKTSETYAMLAEEGSVFMNVGANGKTPGQNEVDVYGNLGVINKNYGMDPNPENHASFVSVGLTTKTSKLTGGILNEFEESGMNKHDSGVDLYLQNGATWDNQWIGAHRAKATPPRNPRKDAEKYLYKGSKVRNLIGGAEASKAGVILQNEEKDITIKNFSGHVKVIYNQNKDNAKVFDGGAIRIEKAADKSGIVLRSNVRDFKKPTDRAAGNYDDVMNALAGKLFYTAKDKNLSATAEIAETLTAPAYTKAISFKDNGQGEVKAAPAPKPGENPGEEPKKEVKTYTTKLSIDGKNKLYHSSDPLKKAGILKDTGKYEFTEDAIVNAKEIDGTAGDVTISAEGKTITFNVTEPIGIRSYGKRGYHSDGKYPAFNDVTVTAKKIILNVSQKDSKKSGKDAFGVAAGSGAGKTVTIKGDLEANVDNKYYKDVDGDGDKEPTFTNGIGAINQGKVLVEGNVDLKVFVPGQEKVKTDHDGDIDHSHFLNHYFINGLFVGLNYDKGPGSEIKITGNANIRTNGTAMHAGARSTITILGGGEVKIDKHEDFAQFAMDAEEGIINMNVTLDEKGMVTGAGKGTVKMEGNIGLLSREETGTIYRTQRTAVNLALVNKDSYFTGIIHDDFREVDRNEVLGSAKKPEITEALKKVRAETGTTLYLQNGATWNNESWGAIVPDTWRNVSHKFTGSKVKALIGGENAEKAGIINQNHGRDITIDDFSGHVKVVYKQNSADAKAFDGGAIHIKKAADKSGVTVRSHVKNFKMPEAEKSDAAYDDMLNALAGKVFYEAKDKKLSGVAEITETLTKEAYAKAISFKDDGQGEVKKGEKTIPPKKEDKKPGLKPAHETPVMKGIKNATLSSSLLWFNHSNDLLRRMGDLRLADAEHGVWAKYQGGHTKLDTKDINISQKYNLIEVGYDTKKEDWTLGGAFAYATAKDDYVVTHKEGTVVQTGDGKTYALSGYATKMNDDGSYLDLIAKVGRVKNAYVVKTKDYDTDKKNGDRVKGDYNTDASTLSAEYGKRIEYGQGFYVEPSVELTISHLVGRTEDVVSEQKTKMRILQDPVTSRMARLGVAMGMEGENGHIYGKLSVAHEFAGEYHTYFQEEGQKPQEVKLDLKDTWIDLTVGGSYKMSRNSYIYGNFTKNFGAKLENKWRLDAGLRFAF